MRKLIGWALILPLHLSNLVLQVIGLIVVPIAATQARKVDGTFHYGRGCGTTTMIGNPTVSTAETSSARKFCIPGFVGFTGRQSGIVQATTAP